MNSQVENIHCPPVIRLDEEDEVRQPHPFVALASFLFLPVIGLCFGFFVMLVTDLYIKSQIPVGTSVRQHAMEGIVVSMPICLLMGVAIGVALAFAAVRFRLIAVGILLLATVAGGVVTMNSWSHYVAVNGRDPSEKLLYYPPIVLVVISCLMACTLGLLLALRALRTNELDCL